MESVRGPDSPEQSRRAQAHRQEAPRIDVQSADERRVNQQQDERSEGRGRELDEYA